MVGFEVKPLWFMITQCLLVSMIPMRRANDLLEDRCGLWNWGVGVVCRSIVFTSFRSGVSRCCVKSHMARLRHQDTLLDTGHVSGHGSYSGLRQISVLGVFPPVVGVLSSRPLYLGNSVVKVPAYHLLISHALNQ